MDITGRAVEVLWWREDGTWTVGSGFLAADRRVLTAAHNVCDGGVVAGEIWVRLLNHAEVPAEVLHADAGHDLALLGTAEIPGLAGLTPIRFARVDRSVAQAIEGCWAIGFPRWRETGQLGRTVPLRDTSHIDGVTRPAPTCAASCSNCGAPRRRSRSKAGANRRGRACRARWCSARTRSVTRWPSGSSSNTA